MLDPKLVPDGISASELQYYQTLGSQSGYEHLTAVTGLAGYNFGPEQKNPYSRLTAEDVGPYANSNEL